MRTVYVDIWSDFVCPWCWIAKRRLERAARLLDDELQVIVKNHAYRLAKGMAPIDFATALNMKFGSELQARAMMDAVFAQGQEEGLTYNFDTMRFGDTQDAHALVKCFDGEAAHQKIIETLSLASITNGQDIFDRNVLRTIAAQAGMSEEQAAAIDFDRAHAIKQDEIRANTIANGVPLFLLNNKAYLSGAQPIDTFVAVLSQIAAESSDLLNMEQGTGCSIDGCRI